MSGHADPARQPLALRGRGGLGAALLDRLAAPGRCGAFLLRAGAVLFIPASQLPRLGERIRAPGYRSLTIVIVTGAFTGMVLALQLFLTRTRFGSEAFVGPALALALIRELGSVLCALIVTGRA